MNKMKIIFRRILWLARRAADADAKYSEIRDRDANRRLWLMIKTTTDNTEESEKAGPVITQPRKTRPGKRSLYNKQTGSLTGKFNFQEFFDILYFKSIEI